MARLYPEQSSDFTPRISERSSSYRQSIPARSPSIAPPSSPSPSSDKENRLRQSVDLSMEPAAKRLRLDRHDQLLAVGTQTTRPHGNPDLQYYDPNQDIEERRVVRKSLRELNREAVDLRQEWMAPGSTGLQDAIARADVLYQSVKQTSDATIDSRLLVTVGDLTCKKTQQIVLGDGAQGIDVDDFVSKCIAFMNRGAESGEIHSSTQRRRRQAVHDDSDGEEGGLERGDALNWEWFGAKACFPSNARPPVPGFLLGPLSLQKRLRPQRQRRERLQRQGPIEAVRPAEIRAADLQQAENATLTTLCKNILRRFEEIRMNAHRQLDREVNEDTSEEEIRDLQRKLNICDDGGISLFRFTVNPSSFGQTVENLFYVSFLIREGHIGVFRDSDGMPTLHRVGGSEEEDSNPQQEQREQHQAVFSLDFETWRQLVEVFNISKSLIPDRKTGATGTQPGASAWYT